MEEVRAYDLTIVVVRVTGECRGWLVVRAGRSCEGASFTLLERSDEDLRDVSMGVIPAGDTSGKDFITGLLCDELVGAMKIVGSSIQHEVAGDI